MSQNEPFSGAANLFLPIVKRFLGLKCAYILGAALGVLACGLLVLGCFLKHFGASQRSFRSLHQPIPWRFGPVEAHISLFFELLGRPRPGPRGPRAPVPGRLPAGLEPGHGAELSLRRHAAGALAARYGGEPGALRRRARVATGARRAHAGVGGEKRGIQWFSGRK